MSRNPRPLDPLAVEEGVLNDLFFLGTVDGAPLYARSSDVTGSRADIRRHHRTTTDLGEALRSDDELAEGFGEIDPVFMAVEPSPPAHTRPRR